MGALFYDPHGARARQTSVRARETGLFGLGWSCVSAALISAGVLCAVVFANTLRAQTPWSPPSYSAYTPERFSASPAVAARINLERVDTALLNAAIFYETNRRRVAEGLPALAYSPALEKSAQMHANDMVAQNFFDHISPVAGRRSPFDRMALAGVNSGLRGENIAEAFGIEYEPGRAVFGPAQNGGDFFSYQHKGAPILPHTYSGLARAAVESWMNSPGHRENILQPRFAFLGAACAGYRSSAFQNIPMFKCVQNFGSVAPPGPGASRRP